MKHSVALIGNGFWGSKLKRYLEENPSIDLKVVCNSKSDLEKEVFRNESIEAVVVATRNDSHYKLVKECLKNDLHVLCEKPLSLDVVDILDLEKTAREKKLTVQTDFTLTFSQALKTAYKLIHDDEISTLKGVSFTSMRLGRFYRSNVYWNLASHWLAVLDMFHPLHKVSFKKTELVTSEGTVETATITGSKHTFGKKMCSVINVSHNNPWKETKAIFYGNSGTIKYDPSAKGRELEMVKYDRNPKAEEGFNEATTVYSIDEGNNLRETVKTWIDVLEGRAESNIYRSTKVTEIIERLQEK